MTVTLDDVRRVALPLPRTYERLVRDRVKFRVGQLVYLSVSADERSMGFAFPKQERDGLVAAEPDKFFPPVPSDERYNWVQVWLTELDEDELAEIVTDAWRMAVPKRVAAAHLGADPR
jgi:hypothetical protein